jgi:hypothetical protein
VLQTSRWDYDLGNPDVRAAWQRGETAKFYPYGKTYAQVFAEGD